MTDFPTSNLQSANSTGKLAATFAGLTALFRSAICAFAQANVRNAERRAMRRAPEDILMAQARREEARRAVDRLLR